MTLPAGTPIGKYIVRRKLAEGGMAEIFLCKATGAEGFEKEVVIKRVRPALAHDEQFVEMFITEARLASRLNHPNVVQIYDFAKHEDTYYLAMEYVRGASLYDVRKRAREMMMPMPVTLAAQLCMEVARGLHYAHKLTDRSGDSLKLVHRDVTPHNVLLSFDGAVKLTDFGIAKAGNKLSQAGSLKGKFAYMSPEQSRGEDIDARSDIFALGIVLWELLTGGRLFEADSDIQLLRVVQTRAIAPPRRLNPDVPEELDRIVLKALERDPAARYQTAQELERALWQVVAANARSVEDTDLPAYLRQLYPEADHASRYGGTLSVAAPVDPGTGPSPAAPPKREPTAVMRPDAPGASQPKSWDDDAYASTHVVKRHDVGLGAAEDPQGPPAAEPAPAAVGVATAQTRDGDVRAPLEAAADAPASIPSGEPQAAAQPSAPPRSTEAPTVAHEVPQRVPRRSAPLYAGIGVALIAGAVAVVASSGGRSDDDRTPLEAATVSAVKPADAPPVSPPVEAKPPPQLAAAAPTTEEAGRPGSGDPAAPGATPPTAAAAPTQPAAPAPSSADETAAPIDTGAIELTIVPWADVTLDGQFYKNVMFKRRFVLPTGRHHLKLQHRRQVREYQIDLKPGEVVRKVEKFRK